MRFGLRTIVQAEDGLDRTDQLGGQTDAALTDAINVAVESFLRQGDGKGLLHRSDRPGQLDGAPLWLGCAFLDG